MTTTTKTSAREAFIDHTQQQLSDLVVILTGLAAQEDAKPRETSGFIHGLNRGYASGYRLAAGWLQDILDGEDS